jgi:DNA-binding transcriptional ArsR family regulator
LGRPLSSDQIAAIKAGFFRVLGHPARVRILEILRDGDQTVGELQALLELDSSSTSQHLAALKQQGIVVSTKHGTHVHYSARDPRVFQLLEVARIIIVSHLDETRALLEELSSPEALPISDAESLAPQ